ncbi:Integrase [Theobroma cacao]|nr:Integrase [Theobroma cacao]
MHAPVVQLHNIITPWPFHTWAFNLIRPINSPSKGYTWILARTKCFIEWVEAISLKNVTVPAVANFIKENIICKFGIPRRILLDNGTPFINANVKELLALYDVDHAKSTLYHSKGNGQAEATNKTLLKVLNRMAHEKPKMWHDALLVVLWAYRTFKYGLTKATLFSLVYGTEAVLLAEILVSSARLALDVKLDNDNLRMLELEALEEIRDRAKKDLSIYQRRLSRAYDKLVKRRNFERGDLVPCTAEHIRRGTLAYKFSPK